MVIFDTNILIEIYRGNDRIREKIYALDFKEIYISDITAAEFLLGARNKQEFSVIKKQLSFYTNIPVNDEICEMFLELCHQFTLSHRPSIPDLLIASTAVYHQIPLFTLNRKDFVYIPNRQLISL